MQHLEVRMLAHEPMEMTRQAEALGQNLPQPGGAEGPEHHPDLEGAEGPRHLWSIVAIVGRALAFRVLAEVRRGDGKRATEMLTGSSMGIRNSIVSSKGASVLTQK